MALRSYSGNAKRTTLSGDITATSTTFSVSDATGYPNPQPGDGPFVVVFDLGLAGEEKALIASRSGNTFTVSQRGFDGTTATPHTVGALVDHTLSATDIREVNAHANDATGDPHPQYLQAGEVTGLYTPASHTSDSDPHAQYLTQSEGDARYPLKTDTDPYPAYLTTAEGDARYATVGASGITQTQGDARYLQISGGTVSGGLTVQANAGLTVKSIGGTTTMSVDGFSGKTFVGASGAGGLIVGDGSLNGNSKVITISSRPSDATSVAGAGHLYVLNGALRYVGSSGTTTTIAPA